VALADAHARADTRGRSPLIGRRDTSLARGGAGGSRRDAPLGRGSWLLPRVQLHPAQMVVLAFAIAVIVGTVLLALPVARAGDGSAPTVTALFTSTSAVCVTGLTIVDTPTYWSAFGEAVILGLIQVGGFGIMTLASLLVLLVSRRLGLRTRLIAQAETKTLGLGDVRRVVRGVAVMSLAFEAVGAAILGVRLWASYDLSATDAAYRGVFHAVSSFNNAGFALYSTSLTPFVGDAVVCVTVMVLVVAGGLGFPVLFELRRELRRPRRWSLHTKLVVATTAVLLVLGAVAVTALEWGNRATLGPLSVPDKLLAGAFQGVMPRTAGFNTLDYSQMDEATWLVTDLLMFVGGAPAGTAGGIKVTTFVVLALVVIAEIRGDRAVNVLGRRLPTEVQRQAVSVALLAMTTVIAATVALLLMSGIALDRILFEATSAFSTVGLSTGITADLPDAGHVLLVVLMFVGRLGPITFAAALALRRRHTLYRFPEERPIVG
jgi:potassium uptake TrkH family protein